MQTRRTPSFNPATDHVRTQWLIQYSILIAGVRENVMEPSEPPGKTSLPTDQPTVAEPSRWNNTGLNLSPSGNTRWWQSFEACALSFR